MAIYYRSDTRNPDEIFKNGFSPSKDTGNDWIKNAIHLKQTEQYLQSGEPVDASSEHCVCLTSKFESAALFPTDDRSKETYIYVISLPDASKVKFKDPAQTRLELDINRNNKISSENDLDSLDFTNLVIDLHSLQASQGGYLLAKQNLVLNPNSFFYQETDHSRRLLAGWPLYAYEAVAHHIPNQNIICALKCTREPNTPTLFERPLSFNTEIPEPISCPSREFHCDDLKLNQNFNSQLINNEEYKEVITMVEEKIKQHDLHTPNVYYGFGGITF